MTANADISTGLPPGARLEPAEITARSRSNFLTGFLCLDAARRAGMTAIYAFCRVVDDAVDEAVDRATAAAHLRFWRGELDAAAAGAAGTPVGRAVQTTMQRFGLGPEPLREVLDGMAMDLEPRGFADEGELRLYCRRVASAVGLACLPVLGVAEPAGVDFAEHLGQALQRTNILRDLRPDAAIGRCYVPATWLREAGVEPGWLGGEGPATAYAPGGPVAVLQRRLAEGARAEFAAARAALRRLPRRSRRALVPARIMGAVYGDLLRRLASGHVDLRGPKVRVGRPRKLWLALLVLAGVRA
ncbi:MAG: squalene/phytoene synthase family protein [Planctomycetes bacterium]|nr:squalene/phytoene synthase family protein [Planctomycetota bacterium]